MHTCAVSLGLILVLAACGSGSVPIDPRIDAQVAHDSGLHDDAPPAPDDAGVIDPGDPSLVEIDDLHFVGAFRIPAEMFGESSVNYSGPIAATDHGSFFIVGHPYEMAIAEIDVPELVESRVVTDLNMADAPRQPFASVLDRAPRNPDALETIVGLYYLDAPSGPELLVDAIVYYDAAASARDTTLIVRDANDLAGSAVDGFFALDGAAHAGGWISEVPPEWRSMLGGDYVAGASSGLPIIGRLSVGPSAFVFDALDLAGTDVPDPVPTAAALDFSLDHPLHDDLSNDSRTNDLWTHLSHAVYGFVAPGTRSYLTFGESGGHVSGVCYKEACPHECGGYCPIDESDHENHFWFFDVDDLVRVRDGALAPHDVRPYAYGVLPSDFDGPIHGGAFDASTGRLYLSYAGADHDQGEYFVPPVIAVYELR